MTIDFCFLGNINQTVILGQKFCKSGEVFEKFEGVPIYLFRAPFFEKEITNLE